MAGSQEFATIRQVLRYLYGPMGAGKTTLLCQDAHNRLAAGQIGTVITFGDRSDSAAVTARAGLVTPAVQVDPNSELWPHTVDISSAADRRFLLVDEVQFATADQIDELADTVDRTRRSAVPSDVTCYGLATDFTGRLFPGAARLFEVADVVEQLPLAVWCWCGAPATHNGRLDVDGRLATTGPTIAVGDVGGSAGGYVVVCRQHHRQRRAHANEAH